MKKIVIANLFLAVVTAQARAEFAPGWDRPIRRADMEVSHNPFSQTKLEQVVITLTHQDGIPGKIPTGMIVEFKTGQNQYVSKKLVINKMRINNCGPAEYDAVTSSDENIQANDHKEASKLSVHLVDHTQINCLHSAADSAALQSAGWEALIGTPEASFNAAGEPQDLFSIQNSDIQ